MKNSGRKYNVWAVMPSPLPQSCLLPLFFTHLQFSTQQFKLCWILVYIRGCNICENTFGGNNPIRFHFSATFYCYLLFPGIQKPLISFLAPCKTTSSFIKMILWNSAGVEGQRVCWNSLQIEERAGCDRNSCTVRGCGEERRRRMQPVTRGRGEGASIMKG